MGRLTLWPKRVRDPLNLTLAGMPELELFPSDEVREQALRELSREPGRRKSIALGATLVVVAMLAVSFAAQWLLSLVAMPTAVSAPLFGLAMAITLFVSLRWMHRWAMEHELRRKLLQAGVPVCIRCGYALHGLSLASARCPECGRKFSGRARELITAETCEGGRGRP